MTYAGLSLEGKVALVTGSARGIGQALALGLAQAGAAVAVSDMPSRLDLARGTQAQIEALGQSSAAYPLDVLDLKSISDATDRVVADFGRLDILVSNAAIRPHEPFTGLTLEEWQRVRGVVLDGAFHVAHAAIPNMAKNGYGRVVFFTGDGAFKGTAQRAHVSAAKMGVIGLARGLASEFAPKNIRVNVISPGRIDTTRDLSWYPQGGMRDTADIPVGRLGSVNDMASACLFLITDECGFMTGQTLHINGGTDFF